MQQLDEAPIRSIWATFEDPRTEAQFLESRREDDVRAASTAALLGGLAYAAASVSDFGVFSGDARAALPYVLLARSLGVVLCVGCALWMLRVRTTAAAHGGSVFSMLGTLTTYAYIAQRQEALSGASDFRLVFTVFSLLAFLFFPVPVSYSAAIVGALMLEVAVLVQFIDRIDPVTFYQTLALMLTFAIAGAMFSSVANRARRKEFWLRGRLESAIAELTSVNKELQNFTYSVSHDLKAPLRSMSGFSQILLSGHTERLDDEGRDYLGRVAASAKRMSQLIDDLLAYAKVDRTDQSPSTVELSELVDSILADRASDIRTLGVSVRTERLDGVSLVCDQAALSVALGNLVDNALKFSRLGSAPFVEIGARVEKDTTTLWVRDNGIGFDMQYHDTIFEPFRRLERSDDIPGTGIGLAMVAKAIARLGGRCRAESTPKEGSTFLLELPRHGQHPGP